MIMIQVVKKYFGNSAKTHILSSHNLWIVLMKTYYIRQMIVVMFLIPAPTTGTYLPTAYSVGFA